MAGPSVTSQINKIVSNLTGEARRQLLIRTAQEGFRKYHKQNTNLLGGEPPYRRVVDGIEGKPITAVNLYGTIIYEWGLHLHIIDEALKMLIQMSPIESPASDPVRYVDHHKILVNGDSYTKGADIGINDIVQITNLVPYARRIEHGWSPQADDGVYQLVAEILKRKYSKVVDIEFTYEDYVGGKDIPGKPFSPKKLSQVRYPTIIIGPKGYKPVRRYGGASVAKRKAIFGVEAPKKRGRPRKR